MVETGGKKKVAMIRILDWNEEGKCMKSMDVPRSGILWGIGARLAQSFVITFACQHWAGLAMIRLRFHQRFLGESHTGFLPEKRKTPVTKSLL